MSQQQKNVKIYILQPTVGGVDTDWHPGDVVSAPEAVALDLIARERAVRADDQEAIANAEAAIARRQAILEAQTAANAGAITNRAADVDSRDPKAKK